MKYGFVLPSGDARTAAGMAQAAEEAGWDGFFVWDPVWGIDPWVALAAAAMQTRRIRLGTMITPVSRQRPWALAGQTATLDNLSGGRVILAVGLGAVDTGFAEFGEVTDRKTRAELLDEGLEIIDGLWRGQPFSFEGKHYHVRPTEFSPPPPPVLRSTPAGPRPHIPIWVVGAGWRPKSLARALRWDGVLPARMTPDGRFEPVTAQDVADIRAYAAARRPPGLAPLDIIVDGETPGDDSQKAAAQLRPLAEAGATWWIETLWEAEGLEPMRERIRQGPPKS